MQNPRVAGSGRLLLGFQVKAKRPDSVPERTGMKLREQNQKHSIESRNLGVARNEAPLKKATRTEQSQSKEKT